VNGQGTNARFGHLYGLTIDPSRTIFVSDYYSNCVRSCNASTGNVSSYFGTSRSHGFADGTGTNAAFSRPNGLTYGAGAVFIADGNNRIRAGDVATRVVTTLAGNGTMSCLDGAGSSATFWYPAGIAYFGGSVYVGDNCNWIRAVNTTTREVTRLAGGGSGNGIGTAAGLGMAVAITASSSGVLYACISGQVRAIVIATRVVTTLAGAGDNNYADGVGTAAKFNRPQGISIFEPSTLLISDGWNSRIRAIDIGTATVTTLVGGGPGLYANGRGSSASFQGPIGIAVDDAGNIFVADSYNTMIRVVYSA
jgi:hypothetical protein